MAQLNDKETQEIAKALLQRHLAVGLIKGIHDAFLGSPEAEKYVPVIEAVLTHESIVTWLVQTFPQVFGRFEVTNPEVLNEVIREIVQYFHVTDGLAILELNDNQGNNDDSATLNLLRGLLG